MQLDNLLHMNMDDPRQTPVIEIFVENYFLEYFHKRPSSQMFAIVINKYLDYICK